MKHGIEKWDKLRQIWRLYGWYPTEEERDKLIQSLRGDTQWSRYRPINY